MAYRSSHLAGTPRRYRLHAAMGTASMLAHGGVPITSKMISSSWCVARLPTGPSVAYDSSSVGVGGKSALVMANTGATWVGVQEERVEEVHCVVTANTREV